MALATKLEEVAILEHATLKIPYELLNKKFRAVQKVLDREVSQVTSTSDELTSCVARPDPPASEVAGLLGSVSQKLGFLKRRSEGSIEEELECTRLCKARLEHLKKYVSTDQTEGVKNSWRKTRVDRMLVDHFLRAGHYTAALRLAESSSIAELVDVEIFLVCQKVEDALREHNTAPCLVWCHDNRSKLRRLNSTLEFQVRLQDFIELVRQDRRVEAIKYARKHFNNGGKQLLKEMQSAMGLLAYSPTTRCKRYQKLFSSSRWENLISNFRQENFNLFQLSSQSVLTVTLQAGLSALKTPQCYKAEEFSVQCPVCSKPFNELAEPLPFSHCSQSYLICNISGKPMNEHNPPMALPNGYVYGEEALKQMSEQTGGEVTCPRTQETFQFSDVRKVYVM